MSGKDAHFPRGKIYNLDLTFRPTWKSKFGLSQATKTEGVWCCFVNGYSGAMVVTFCVRFKLVQYDSTFEDNDVTGFRETCSYWSVVVLDFERFRF